MTKSITDFVVEKLNGEGVSLAAVSAATGIPERTLHHLRAGNAGNAWASRVETLALHFGYTFKPVRASRAKAA